MGYLYLNSRYGLMNDFLNIAKINKSLNLKYEKLIL